VASGPSRAAAGWQGLARRAPQHVAGTRSTTCRPRTREGQQLRSLVGGLAALACLRS